MAANNLINRITRGPQATLQYFKEAYNELRKVSWPSRPTTVQYTVMVAVSSIVAGLVIGGVDFLLALALEQLII